MRITSIDAALTIFSGLLHLVLVWSMLVKAYSKLLAPKVDSGYPKSPHAVFSRCGWLTTKGFSLVEILVGSLMFLVVLSIVYFLFISGARQADRGSEKLQGFQRMRIITEILKDDLREATIIIAPDEADSFSNELIYKKFISSPMLDVGSVEVSPKAREVRYYFDQGEHRLVGTYGSGIELVNTTIFDDVGFQKYRLAGREFVRIKFSLKRDGPKGDSPVVTIYQTIAPRYLASTASHRFWRRIQSVRVEDE